MTVVVHPGDSLTPRQRLVYVLVLGALTALGPFTVDMYLPAFPLIEADLDVSAAAVQLTLTATMLGFAVGQLFMGPWSDRVGRRLPLILATSVHVAASLGVFLSPSIEWLFVFRVLQGAGAAAGGVVAMAVVRDLFGGLPLVRMLSRLALVSGLAPILAPVVGSQLLLVLPWRGMFAVLALYGLLVVVASAVFIVETLPPARHAWTSATPPPASATGALFTDRIFVHGVRDHRGDDVLGHLRLPLVVVLPVPGRLRSRGAGVRSAVRDQLGRSLRGRADERVPGPLHRTAMDSRGRPDAARAHGGHDRAARSARGRLHGHRHSLVAVHLLVRPDLPCTQVLALAQHGSEAGTAASLLGALNFGIAGLISPIVGLFGIDNAVPMGTLMGASALVSIVVLWVVVRPRTVPPLVR